jgi:hypothetical protein
MTQETLDLIMCISMAVQTVAVVGGMIIAVLQLSKSREIARAEYDWKRKNETIQFYHQVREANHEAGGMIRTRCGDDRLTQELLEENAELKRAVSTYLSLMERLALGINVEVYDYDVYKSLFSDSTRTMYEKVTPYIDEKRRSGSNALYVEYEKLAKRLQADYDSENRPELSAADKAKTPPGIK